MLEGYEAARRDLDLLVKLVMPEEVWAASLGLTGVVQDEQKTETDRQRRKDR